MSIVKLKSEPTQVTDVTQPSMCTNGEVLTILSILDSGVIYTSLLASNNVPDTISPKNYEWLSPNCETLARLLGCVLTRLFSTTSVTPSDNISPFHSSCIPKVNIHEYLKRIAFYSEASNEALILSVIQIFRIHYSRLSQFPVNSRTIHRLLIASIRCNSKYQDDTYYDNAYFARIGGITVKEMNSLEVDFLAVITFGLYVSSDAYKRFYEQIKTVTLHNMCPCNNVLSELPIITYGIQSPAPGVDPVCVSATEDGDPDKYPFSSSGYSSLLICDT
jgi:hypothetical protein